MMKLNVLAVLVVAGVTGSLMSMEQKNKDTQRLNFLLGHNWRIKQYSAQNMEYAVPPSEFVGKKLTDAVSLSEHDRNVLKAVLVDAAEKQITVKTSYTLENKQFSSKITPLIKKNKKDEQRNYFFVKVTPVAVERAY